MMETEAMSRCEDVRERLWPLDELRAVVEGEGDARAHLEGCSDCQAFFRRDGALTSRLRSVEPGAQAPAEFRERLMAALAQAEMAQPGERAWPGRLSRAAPLIAVAATMLIAALGLLRLAPQSLDALYVEAYQEGDPEEMVLWAPEGDQAYEFFMRELGLPVTPVIFAEGRVKRAVICLIEGRRTAVIEYELDGHTVAHYRSPIASEDGGGAMHSATEDGVCVVRWSDGEFEHALVADIPEEELRVIAELQFAALR